MTKLKQKEKKDKKRIKCPCCNRDKKIYLCYYRNGKYFINKSHWMKYKKKEEDKNESK